MATALPRSWMRRGLLASALFPVSLLFRFLVAIRRTLYQAGALKSVRLSVPVIIVGNIFVGGTGKTPFTIWLVDQMRRAGYVPGVVSRGYGARNRQPVEVTAVSTPADVGDEPVLIAHHAGCPVMVGRDRVAAAQTMLAAHPEVNLIISDDGLQHYALERDVEIIISDDRGHGNGWMLPAGPLREPASRPRDFTIVNTVRQPAHGAGWFPMQIAGDTAERLSNRSQSIALNAIRSQRIVAAAGIGNPSRFFAMLRSAGLTIEELPLPDHYDFADNPFARVSADIILITEKDAVKCTQIDTIKNDPRLWVVPVTARLDRALAERIVEKCRGRPTA
ncbi:MAG TPA: tetraacyldisaccharide 4'-kinase [Noviherbaspirillum sp.]|uniref:tetraacyldisaccharide 4'-kinase n=1 Tax=Noviherbaspirillum sp. TaxID=1926288 RepID=UPI002B4731D1|nr:tetraacyldisaccharide 4'-kinase [Noviherbaspirillum sp.]HJV86378.1 tetraacyldisaccharide 4'-kinase [Noviherbaspirillum sp.]